MDEESRERRARQALKQIGYSLQRRREREIFGFGYRTEYMIYHQNQKTAAADCSLDGVENFIRDFDYRVTQGW